jgi:acyl-CoA thioesterase-1
VLLIGDSISIGYTLKVRELLAGKANVHRPPTNCGSTNSGIANIDKWLGAEKWDIIHFNWGLHDLKYLQSGRQNVPPEKYEANLKRLVDKMRKKATTLIFATTTPIPETQRGIYPRKQGDVARYNEIALRVMKAGGVLIDDLNTAITPDLAAHALKEDVHFNRKGYDTLAQAVAASLEKNLPPAASPPKAQPRKTASKTEPRKTAAPLSAPPRAPASAESVRVTKIEPRIWRCDFNSAALGGRAMRFMVVLPENITPETITPETITPENVTPQTKPARRVPVIYFLHGRGRHDRSLLEDATCRARLLASPCAIVLPYAREGWYINSPAQPAERYADYIDEVIALSARHFPIGDTPAARAIGGWSMGGYGAMYTACRRANQNSTPTPSHPHPAPQTAFAAIATIIGLLDFPTPKETGGYAVPERFGDDPAEWAARNPLRNIGALRDAQPRPRLHLAYATRAPERGMNERFIAAAQAAGLPPEVVTINGGHTFPSVQTLLPGALSFLETALSAKDATPDN